MKHSAAVCCAAAVSQRSERCLKQVRVKSQSSFVFTGVAAALCFQHQAHKIRPLANCRKRLPRRQKEAREMYLFSVQCEDRTRESSRVVRFK